MAPTNTTARDTTLRDFVSVLFRRKGIVLTVFLTAVIAVVALQAAQPESYVSMARLLITRGEPESVFNTRYKLLSWEEELSSEIEVLVSPFLLDRAQGLLRTAGVTDEDGNPLGIAPEQIKANPSGRASVVAISYSAPAPNDAREALRAITRAYIDWRQEERNVPVVERFFQEELEALRDRMTEWESRRADFMTEEQIIDIASESGSLLRQRESAALQLTEERARLADFAARLEAVEALQRERRLDRQIDVFGLGDKDFNDESLLANLRREIIVRRSDYFEKRSRFTDEHPVVMAAKDIVTNLEKQLDVEISNYMRFLDARIAVARSRIASLEATVSGVEEELLGFPDKAARLAQYDRIIEALRTDYRTLTEKQISARVESTGRAEWKVTLLQPATAAVAEKTRDYVRLALIPLFALLFGLALAFLVDGMDHSLKGPDDAEQHLGVPVLGSLSRMR